MSIILIPIFALQLLCSNLIETGPEAFYQSFYERKDGSELSVKFTGQDLKSGALMIAVYNDSKSFLGESAVFRKRVAYPELVNGTYRIKLPAGTYAIAAYLDQNYNLKLDRNLFQYPTEPYGFSNNARGTVGPPSFENASFKLQGSMEIEISLI